MSEIENDKKKPVRRIRRRRREGEDGSESGEESDTIFDEQSDYESAEEDHEFLEDATDPYQQAEGEEVDYLEDGTPSQSATQDDKPIIILTRETAALDISGDQPTDLETDLDVTPVQTQEDEPQGEVEVLGEDTEVEEGDEEGESLEKRGDGDGQEEPSEEPNLDDDEDLKNPAYIPRGGAYYQHDVRNEDKADKRSRRDRRLWKEDDRKWLHDRYNEEEQAPKSPWELINDYGYDIRDPTQQDRASEPIRRGRGRGIRGRGQPSPGGGGRGRGRGLRYQRSPPMNGGGDGRPEPRRYIRTGDSESRGYDRTEDFPELPGHGQTREDPKPASTYASRAWGSREGRGVERRDVESSTAPSMRMKYQSEKTYYERDDVVDRGDDRSFKNVTADFRYRPSGNRSVQAYRTQEPEYETQKRSSPRGYRDERVDRYQKDHTYERETPREDEYETQEGRERDYEDQKREYYQLEFVNKNYVTTELVDREDRSEPSHGRLRAEGGRTRPTMAASLKQEPPESPRKTYSQERLQRSRPQVADRGRTPPPDEEDDTDRTPPMRNLKIRLQGSGERVVRYEDRVGDEGNERERGDDDRRQRFIDADRYDDEEEEEQRADRREQRSRPKRYSSQRQRGQEPAAGSQLAAESAPGKGKLTSRSPESSLPPSGRGPSGPSPRQSSPQANQAVQSSLPPNLQSLMQQGLMMHQDAHGVRAPHLPSPAFFQQQQQGPPPAYYVGPMVNYGSAQYPGMATPLQFQHYPMSMPPPPPPAVPANPPAPPPPQTQAAPSSVQQVGGVTYYSPLQQPLPLHQPPHKRPSKPITIESPPDIRR